MLPGNHSADAVSARGASGVSGGSSYAQLQSSIVCHESPAPPSDSLPAHTSTDAATPWFPLPRRVVLLLLCITAAIINYSDRQNISYAILKMAAELGWSDEKKGWVLSSFYLGYFISNVPAGYATERFGGRRVMIGGAFFWSLFTLLTPPAATYSFPLLIIVRVLLGASEGFCWPAAHALLGRWFPTSERGRAVAFLNSGAFIGNLLTIAIAPPLITSSGWPVSFYLFGGLGFVFIAAWMHLVHETPREHPHISADELKLVESEISTADQPSSKGSDDLPAASAAATSASRERHRAPIPWRAFFTDRQFWAFYLNFFASGFGTFVLLAWMPTYFSDQFGVKLADIGFFTAAPYIFQAVCTLIAGTLSQRLIASKTLSPMATCTVMQMLGLVLPILFISLLAWLPSSAVNATGASVLLTAALAFNAFTSAGVQTYAQTVAPRFAGLLFSIANAFGVLPGVIGIAAAGSILEASHSWTLIFLIAISCYAMGIAAWAYGMRGRPLAFDEWESEQQRQHAPLSSPTSE